MLSRLHSVALMGIEALACEVEVDCADRGFEKATIVGLADSSPAKGSWTRLPASGPSEYNLAGGDLVSSEIVTVHGVVRGKTIELEREPGLPDGQQVKVTMEPEDKGSALTPGEGLRRSAGAWADDAEGLDKYLEWNRQQRKLGRREQPE